MTPTRIAAVVLALLSTLPLWRVLPQRATGIAGMATAAAAADYSTLMWMGLVIAMIPALLTAMLADSETLEQKLARMVSPLTRPRPLTYAAILALVAFALAALVASLMPLPTLIDSFAHLMQARYLAAGELAGTVAPVQEFWHIQQTAITPGGWVSQYPPGYTVLLAAGFVIGQVWLIGPFMFGIASFFTALIADEVFTQRALGRVAALLAVLSPFMLTQAGAYMSHVPAAAFVTAALYCTLRTRDSGMTWAVAAGACIGALFTIRPLTGVVVGLVAVVYTRDVRKTAFAFAAALPLLLAVAWYNAHFFGSPQTFGYTVTLGPGGGLGFGVDPWGNQFGIIEAFAFTSAELAALSVHLLETPLPLVLFIGLNFALSVSDARVALVFWTCCALVFANLFYWHHGMFVGPRMLADTGPLWVLLAVFSVAGLIARLRADWNFGRYNVRAFATGGAVAAVVAGLLILAPQRIASYRPTTDVVSRTVAPQVERPALVFVHGGWTSRIGARLAAHGMRLDSVETALRQNSTCAVHKYSLAYAQRTTPPVTLDFAARATDLPALVEVTPGNRIRMLRDERLDAECAREALSDAAGIVDVSPFVWQAALPGLAPLPSRDVIFARDFGPLDNARLIERYSDREILALTIDSDGRRATQPYDTVIPKLWAVR